jgi:hypothetical protein
MGLGVEGSRGICFELSAPLIIKPGGVQEIDYDEIFKMGLDVYQAWRKQEFLERSAHFCSDTLLVCHPDGKRLYRAYVSVACIPENQWF